MSPRDQRQRGAVLIGALLVVMLAGLATLTYTQSWHAAKQRHLEDELLFVGQQYRDALESYYRSSPGIRHLPVSLDDLVKDDRFPQPVRHLRRIYVDPLAPEVPWGVMRQGAQIIGVYSQASGEPVKRADFDVGQEGFVGARTYSAWQFLFVPRASATPTQPRPSAATRPTP